MVQWLRACTIAEDPSSTPKTHSCKYQLQFPEPTVVSIDLTTDRNSSSKRPSALLWLSLSWPSCELTHRQVHIHMDKYLYTWANMHTHGQAQIHMVKYTYTWKNANTCGQIHLLVVKYTYTWTNMHTHGQIHIYVNKHAYSWSNTHTRGQTCIHIIKINQKAGNESFQILQGKHC